MPLEPAYALALQADPSSSSMPGSGRWCSPPPPPSWPPLWIIANIWQQAQQTANALEIARQGGALYDKFVGFVGTLEEVGRQLERCQNSYNQAVNQLKTGRGNLISRAENLRALGAAASKSLDAKLTAAAAESEGTPRTRQCASQWAPGRSWRERHWPWKSGRSRKSPGWPRGLGWGAVSTRCRGLVISRCLLWAGLPQRRKTTGVSFSLRSCRTRSVNLSHPLP